MKEIDLYTDYLSEDEDKYVFMSVNQKGEAEFRLLVSDGFYVHVVFESYNMSGGI